MAFIQNYNLFFERSAQVSPVIIQVDSCLFAVAVCIRNIERCLCRTDGLGGLMHNVTILVADDNCHVGYGTVGLDGDIIAVG